MQFYWTHVIAEETKTWRIINLSEVSQQEMADSLRL